MIGQIVADGALLIDYAYDSPDLQLTSTAVTREGLKLLAGPPRWRSDPFQVLPEGAIEHIGVGRGGTWASRSSLTELLRPHVLATLTAGSRSSLSVASTLGQT